MSDREIVNLDNREPFPDNKVVLALSFKCGSCGKSHTNLSGLLTPEGNCTDCGAPASVITEKAEYGEDRIKKAVLLVYAQDNEQYGNEVEELLGRQGFSMINTKRILKGTSIDAVDALEMAYLMLNCAGVVVLPSRGMKNVGIVENALQMIHEQGKEERPVFPIYTAPDTFGVNMRGGIGEYAGLSWVDPQNTNSHCVLDRDRFIKSIQETVDEVK